ncbi:MAG: hypothetical protein HXX09_11260 [Bacteroidetes bacterium]|nr:hypothetical protein [Bacteroidota bacterium]
MNKMITQRKMRLASLNQTSEFLSQIADFNNLDSINSSMEITGPSERVIQNILNYAKSLEVLKMKNNFEFVMMN